MVVERTLRGRRLHALTWLLIGVTYVASPLDVVPDLVPVIGWLDDVLAADLTLQRAFALLRRARSVFAPGAREGRP